MRMSASRQARTLSTGLAGLLAVRLARGALLLVLGLGSLAIFLTVSRAAIIAGGLGMLVVAWRSSRAMLFVVAAALVARPFSLPADVKDRPCSP
jgi:hypothetical protein